LPGAIAATGSSGLIVDPEHDRKVEEGLSAIGLEEKKFSKEGRKSRCDSQEKSSYL